MKKFLSAFAVVCLLAIGAHAQSQSILHNVGGRYDARAYQYPGAKIATAPAASGAGSIILTQGWVTLADGTTLMPWTTATPITVNQGGANAETVTPSAVSGCGLGTQQNTCTITATFSNVHGAGESVTSGDTGIQEAINDAAAHGGGDVYYEVDCGIITLNTGAATTTTTCLTPKTFTNLGASVFVTTTITTSASYSIGVATATTAYMTSCTALTAATTCSQFVNAPTKVSTGAGTIALLVTANATAGAGAIHAKVWGTIGAQSSQ
jgi:hypothetical protein